MLDNWPFFVWLALVMLCLGLYLRTIQYGIITGAVQVVRHDISPLQASRVKEICVQIGSRVTKGQVVARMDTVIADTQLAEAQATLTSALNTMASTEGQILSLTRTIDEKIMAAQAELARLKDEQDKDMATLAQLQKIQAERDKLFASRLIADELAVELRPEIAGLEKQVAAYPTQIARAQRTLEEEQKHRADLQKALRLEPGEDVMKAVAQKSEADAKVLQAVLDMRRQEKEACELRAESDGVVSDVEVYPGTIVTPGMPVVSVVSSPSGVIVGYLPEFRLGRVKPGDVGFAFRRGHPSLPVKVVEVVPAVESLPVKLSPISAPLGAVMRSQKVILKAEQASDLIPGEKVEIRMGSEGWAKAKRWLLSLR
jgi:multidrug resistance efflux pump